MRRSAIVGYPERVLFKPHVKKIPRTQVWKRRLRRGHWRGSGRRCKFATERARRSATNPRCACRDGGSSAAPSRAARGRDNLRHGRVRDSGFMESFEHERRALVKRVRSQPLLPSPADLGPISITARTLALRSRMCQPHRQTPGIGGPASRHPWGLRAYLVNPEEGF